MLPCQLCGARIIGRYVQHPRLGDVCARCYDALPVCAGCGARFKVGRDTPPLCPTCDARARPCGLCGELALGATWSHTRCEVICERCHDALPHCHRCGLPARAPTPVGSTTDVLCRHCWRETPRCHICESPLTDRWITYESEPDRAFCHDCAEHAEACDFCGRPLKRPHRYPDGRLSCATCRASAVTELRELRKLQAQSRRYLRDALDLQLRPAPACPIHLVSAAELVALQGRRFHATAGFDTRERGLFVARTTTLTRGDDVVRRDVQLDIYVEDGLPRSAALGTMVHELTHLWQFDHLPPDAPLPLVEGLACWTQFHLLRSVGARLQAKYVALRTDPVYGDGFRAVRAIEREHGFEGTIPALLDRLRAA